MIRFSNTIFLPYRQSNISIVNVIFFSGNGSIFSIILRNKVCLGTIDNILNHCNALFLTSEMVLFEASCRGIIEAAQRIESTAFIMSYTIRCVASV